MSHSLPPQPFFQRFSYAFIRFSENYTLSGRLAAGLSLAVLVSVIITFVVLAGGGAFTDKTARVLPFIYLDLTLMLLLAVIIAKRLVELWVERRRGLAGSKLHVQIVGLFSLITIIPAILVAGFAAIFINVGVQSWFGEPVQAALSEAKEVANAYLKEHNQAIKQEAFDMVRVLAPAVVALVANPKDFSHVLTDQGYFRHLSEVVVFNGDRRVVARSLLSFAFEFEKEFEKRLDWAIGQAQVGNQAVFLDDSIESVRILVRLDPVTDTYLYIGKLADKDVLKHVLRTEGAVKEYDRLREQSSSLQLTFILFFAGVALLLLLAAIWVGLTIANLLMRPITRLIVAAERVSQGDLTVQVTTQGSMNNELGSLALAFNRMTSQLNTQRQDLLKANIQIDRRRQFIETVLTQISAGVIRLDEDRHLDLVNPRAAALLSIPLEQMKGKLLDTIAAELIPLLDRAVEQMHQHFHEQVTIVRQGLACILQVSVIVQQEKNADQEEKIKGYIITFDDVTALASAQRKAAWSDVARRIAHEIKNPLTPIQLSAERLRRRYLKEITSDPTTFQACIDTIIRQVGQIGNLIAEFSSFARMPNPVMKEEDLAELCRQGVFLQKEAHPSIVFQLKASEQPIMVQCDAQQVNQMLTNLLQNAINALEAYDLYDKESLDHRPPALISLTLEVGDGSVCLIVEDNGPGFPQEGRERLTEPYFTTHAKGTGLGLAIVAKIVEDHRGKLELGDSFLGGAKVLVELPVSFENA